MHDRAPQNVHRGASFHNEYRYADNKPPYLAPHYYHQWLQVIHHWEPYISQQYRPIPYLNSEKTNRDQATLYTLELTLLLDLNTVCHQLC